MTLNRLILLYFVLTSRWVFAGDMAGDGGDVVICGVVDSTVASQSIEPGIYPLDFFDKDDDVPLIDLSKIDASDSIAATSYILKEIVAKRLPRQFRPSFLKYLETVPLSGATGQIKPVG